MKKFVSIVALALAISTAASAQSFLGKGLANLFDDSATSKVANIVSGLAGTVYSSPVILDGTYNYNGTAVSVTSSEGGIVANLAGSAVTSGIESKADEILAKIGIVPGALKFNFNAAESTFTLEVAGISIPGNYKVGDNAETVTLTFGKTLQYFCMTGNLESCLSGAKMVFPAKKSVDFLKKIASKLGESSSSVAAIAKLAEGYDNYKIGFKLAK